MNEWTIAILAVAAAAIVAALGAWVARQKLPPGDVAEAIPAAAAIFATFGVIYGVILGQVVVAAWQAYSDAETTIAREADSIVSIARLAEGLPEPERSRVREAAVAYGEAVIGSEWPRMQTGGGASPESGVALTSLYRIVTALPGAVPGGDVIGGAILAELDALDDARGDRIADSVRTIPALMWAALLAGGVMSVAFTYLLAPRSGILHLLMVVAMATLIALLLVVVLGLSLPFRSPLALGPEDFRQRIDLLRQEVGPVP